MLNFYLRGTFAVIIKPALRSRIESHEPVGETRVKPDNGRSLHVMYVKVRIIPVDFLATGFLR